jgi:hypothetical protein
MAKESESQKAGRQSVSRQLNDEDAPSDTEPESLVGPTGGGDAEEAPEGVGESVGRRGEDIIDKDDKEAGRYDTGTDDSPAQRPTGESTARDRTGIDPQKGSGG